MTIDPLFQPLFSDDIDDKRYYQVYGGRGSGKSFTVAVAAVTKTYSEHKHRILYLRQTMSSSEDSTIADVQLVIDIMGVNDDFKYSKGVYTNLKTGSTITFKGIRASGSQSAKLKSLSGITTLIIEEAEEIESFDEFSKVDESIRMKGKPLKVILVYNPSSAIESWIHKEWFIDGNPNPARFHDTIFIHSTYLDNLDNLAPSTVARYNDLKETNPTYYRQTILAEWTLEVANKVYEGWGECSSFPVDVDYWYGLDFGYGGKDNTSLVRIAYHEGAYYLKEIFSKPKMGISDIVTYMRAKKIPMNALIVADSAAPILIEELRAYGYSKIRKARKGINSKEQGIKRLQDSNIIMVGDSPQLYYSYMTWAVDERGKIPHEPDILAATRYGITYKRVGKMGGTVSGTGRVIRQRGYI